MAKRKDIYERLVETYNTSLDDWRAMLYENMDLLMRNNPLLRNEYQVYTKEDILSVAFMLADKILTREDTDEKKKILRLRYLFHKWNWDLQNNINRIHKDWYILEEKAEDESYSYEFEKDEYLDYFLLKNHVITPIEYRIIQYIQEWRWKYEIARMMKTTYYNVKQSVEFIQKKVDSFIKLNNL